MRERRLLVLDHRTRGGALELRPASSRTAVSRTLRREGRGQSESDPGQGRESIELLVCRKRSTPAYDHRGLDDFGAGRNRVWNLAHDIVTNLHENGRGNPHSDSLGHEEVWRFCDMSSSRRAGAAGWREPILRWQNGMPRRGGAAGKAESSRLRQEFQKTFDLPTRAGPFWIDRPEDEVGLPPTLRGNWLLRPQTGDTPKNASAAGSCMQTARRRAAARRVQAGFHDVRVHIRGNYARLGDWCHVTSRSCCR